MSAVVLSAGGGGAQSPGDGKAVLELFTSQGCSSCPAADALLEKYTKRPDVLALTVPVDYWDYLGWKDTLASPVNSQRQRQYARQRGDNQVYTPQIVVNGIEHAVGSQESQIESAIRRANDRIAKTRPGLKMWTDGDQVVIEVGAAPATAKDRTGTLHLAVIKPSEKVSIGRGENEGRTVTYFNVVRQLKTVGTWKGDTLVVRISRAEMKLADKEFCATILQQGQAGPIIAAAELKAN